MDKYACFRFGVMAFIGLVLLSSCSSIYYHAKEQSASIPNVVHQNPNVKRYEFASSSFFGFNHSENQTSYQLTRHIGIFNSLYFSKGFNMGDAGVSYRQHVYDIVYFDVDAAFGIGDMDYSRIRSYTSYESGYNNVFTKSEKIGYRYYKGFVTPSLMIIFDNQIRLSVGARVSATQYKGFDYLFKEEKAGDNGYYKAELQYFGLKAHSLWRYGLEPAITLQIPYRHVGCFLQVMYYQPYNNGFNQNNYGIMSRADIPVLLSAGLNLHFNMARKAKL